MYRKRESSGQNHEGSGGKIRNFTSVPVAKHSRSASKQTTYQFRLRFPVMGWCHETKVVTTVKILQEERRKTQTEGREVDKEQ